MDFLKAEIANKRKALSPPTASASPSASAEPPTKYMRRGELERLQEQQRRAEEQKQKEEREKAKRAREDKAKRPATAAAASASASGSSTPRRDRTTGSSSPAPTTAASSSAKEAFNISNHEAVRRLRAKGQPIRLFAETDKERRLRLRALELIEEKGSTTGQNDFRTAMQSAETDMALELLERRNASDKGKAERDKLDGKAKDSAAAATTTAGKGADGGAAASEGAAADEDDGKKAGNEYTGMDGLLDLSLIKKDTARVYPIIYYTLKGLLQDWAEHMAARPDDLKQTTQGKLAAATQVQASEYLKPLFKQLRKRTLAPDVLMRIAEIVHYMQKREYRNANDSYLQLSIGNAPWPIGVTMVGIHERSGREKIFSSNVAHVLNDEVSRKYIQSLKRLMTFAQTRYPPKDLSMLMG
ncbi:uncharacterized protein PFL1_06852 [Pseudozyma flocculosa PF-1]|uniref:Pre-mRNA-splicing factor 18 n=1 Tax=Pseudozyma flocculosa TaxID=84751 RepID=A0A5C3EZK5_9BASI|nr:uncharacterized protein PFL1_06852 [Pseudozyma flocculosa PF-1]EPQ30566.1 hypothetical protein PFL1_06852 [Pseudozyma flocculosa PF-1]SPO37658.1 related to pre-mrna splicing factor 18 [Pseudozyma flocculosa]